MEGPYANLIIDTLLIIIFVKVVQKVSYFFFSKIFKKNKTRFNFRKKVSFVCNIFLVFIIIIIWEDFLLKFITLFSFVTAAIAYSLRDTIINFFAGIYIRLAKPFQVEDRIMICNHIGDVVNISNLSFEVLEVNNDTFQSTGSIVHIPNSKVISEPLINYVKVFKYVWNETEVKISIDSDIKKVKGILYSIVNNNDIIKSIPGKMINELNNNSSYITGYGAPAGSSSSVTNGTYNTTLGKDASTTGTIYGIYDMSGGAWEYVMGVYNNAKSSSGFNSLPDEKYYNNYTGSSYTGHALTETKNWYSDYADFVFTSYPWFLRGGNYGDGASAGVFGFGINDGNSYNSYSSRPVISNE